MDKKSELRERIGTTIDALCDGNAVAAASFWQDISDYTQAQVDEAVASTITAAAKACNVSEYWLKFQLTTQSKSKENE